MVVLLVAIIVKVTLGSCVHIAHTFGSNSYHRDMRDVSNLAPETNHVQIQAIIPNDKLKFTPKRKKFGCPRESSLHTLYNDLFYWSLACVCPGLRS